MMEKSSCSLTQSSFEVSLFVPERQMCKSGLMSFLDAET